VLLFPRRCTRNPPSSPRGAGANTNANLLGHTFDAVVSWVRVLPSLAFDPLPPPVQHHKEEDYGAAAPFYRALLQDSMHVRPPPPSPLNRRGALRTHGLSPRRGGGTIISALGTPGADVGGRPSAPETVVANRINAIPVQFIRPLALWDGSPGMVEPCPDP